MEKQNDINIEMIIQKYEKKKEEGIRNFCKANGLNENKAEDYAKAATSVLEYMPPVSPKEVEMLGLLAEGMSLIGDLKSESKPCPEKDDEYNCRRDTTEAIQSNQSEYGLFGKKCPKGTAYIKPNAYLNNAGNALEKSDKYRRLKDSIKPFSEGCYGLTEYAAYYAMNKIAECAAWQLLKKQPVTHCINKYLDFRQEGMRDFRQKTSG